MDQEQSTDLHPCARLYQDVLEDPRLTSTSAMIARYEREASQYQDSGIYEICLAALWRLAKEDARAAETLERGLASNNAYHRRLHYDRVTIHIDNQQFEQAIAYAERLTREDLDWAGGYRLLMLAYLGKGAFDEAITHGRAAAERSDEPLNHLGLTLAYYQKQWYHEALGELRKALDLQPALIAQGSGINQGIYALLHLGEYEEASRLIEARQRADRRASMDEALQRAVAFLEDQREAASFHVPG